MSLETKKKEVLHREVSFFEDVPVYDLEKILELQKVHWSVLFEKDEEKLKEGLEKLEDMMDNLTPKKDAPQKIMLWNEGNMPSFHTYVHNADLRFNHDPLFKPYMYPVLIPNDQTPKGGVIVCAGGDHGDCTLHEGYQTCLKLNKLGYQCFLLLNRTNHCPYAPEESGADASRAISLVRKNAATFRIDENMVAFAGFSNGGLTAENCIQYFSGTRSIKDVFAEYIPDEADNYYGAPDAVINVYGPRFKDATFDYSNVVYPPTFFAVGRKDMAMENLMATVPDLLKHQVEVEVHTFTDVPHGQAGVTIYGNNAYPHFELWSDLADVFLQSVFSRSITKHRPDKLTKEYCYDQFAGGDVVLGKKKNHLPAMGWNSWNAFGSGNTESLTKAMADAFITLELDKLGYEYIVLDDGCYKSERVDGKLANEEKKFLGGFKALSDYIHDKGLKFGMYNDIGTNLCAGAFVGTCGHEKTDAKSYIDWGVDFLKVDNCYYLWDNATFSKAENAKYVFAPWISGISLNSLDEELRLSVSEKGVCAGAGVKIEDGFAKNIGTFDGTGPWQTPVGSQSGELVFFVDVKKAGSYDLFVTYQSGLTVEKGSWLQIAVDDTLVYDDFVKASPENETVTNHICTVELSEGKTMLRFMNHRRQENTLMSYAALLEGLNEAKPDHDMIFSICEWGKTSPQNWGYKVGDSWRILNDITFCVGADGNPGLAAWSSDYTPGVATQYNKAVVMDDYAGLDKGWNDPDMLMIGMNGLDMTMNKTHMAMWCMLNAPLMLGLDLRRVKKGDELYEVIANKDLIKLNQDPLGIQAKRIYSEILPKTLEDGCVLEKTVSDNPSKEYIRNNHRVDILAKPLMSGEVAVSFINLSDVDLKEEYEISLGSVLKEISDKLLVKNLLSAKTITITNLWTKEETVSDSLLIKSGKLSAHDNVTLKISAK